MQSLSQNRAIVMSGYLTMFVWHFQFYAAMSLVYLAYGVVWLIASVRQWSKIIRIQVTCTGRSGVPVLAVFVTCHK